MNGSSIDKLRMRARSCRRQLTRPQVGYYSNREGSNLRDEGRSPALPDAASTNELPLILRKKAAPTELSGAL